MENEMKINNPLEKKLIDAIKIVEQLKQDLDIYLEDALEASGETEEDNEWLAQIKAIADAAYGEGNY